MMNTKFRIWCNDNNEWERGVVALLSNGDLWDVNHNMIVGKSSHVVEMYTGKKDKNYNEIYEGDKVISRYTENGEWIQAIAEIKYDESWGSFIQYIDEGIDQMMDVPCEIIGNIHEKKGIIIKMPTARKD